MNTRDREVSLALTLKHDGHNKMLYFTSLIVVEMSRIQHPTLQSQLLDNPRSTEVCIAKTLPLFVLKMTKKFRQSAAYQ